MRYFLCAVLCLVATACSSSPVQPTAPASMPQAQTAAPAVTPTATSLLPISADASTRTITPTPTATPTRKPDPLATELSITTTTTGFTVLKLTSPTSPDGIATVTVRTTPGAQCFLEYRKPDGTKSNAVGLGAQIADANGICSWTWKLSLGNKLSSGTGRLTITVNGVWQFFDIIVK